MYFGYICSAKTCDNKIIYTIQTEGECPSMIFNYKEEMKQYINSHTQQIQKKEEEMFKNNIQDIKSKICDSQAKMK